MLRTFVGTQVVVDAFYQRVLGTYYHHVYLLVGAELLDGLEVVSLHGYILSAVARTGIARGNIQFLTLAALSNLPCQCVLAPATA